EHLSLAPTIMGMYGHTKNFYTANSELGSEYLSQAQTLGVVGWKTDTWTVRPAINVEYIYTWKRTIFTYNSDFTYYHTESFNSTTSLLNINGNSEAWRNMIDVDIPLGKKLFGHEL